MNQYGWYAIILSIVCVMSWGSYDSLQHRFVSSQDYAYLALQTETVLRNHESLMRTIEQERARANDLTALVERYEAETTQAVKQWAWFKRLLRDEPATPSE